MKTLHYMSFLFIFILLQSCSKNEMPQLKSDNNIGLMDSNTQTVELKSSVSAIDSLDIIVSRLLRYDSLLATTSAVNDSSKAMQVSTIIASIDWSGSKVVGKLIKAGKEVCYLDIMPHDLYNTNGVLYQLNWEAESAYETDGESLIFQFYITDNIDSLTFNKMKRATIKDSGKPSIIESDFVLWENKVYRSSVMRFRNLVCWCWSNNDKDYCLLRGDNYHLFKSMYYHCLNNFHTKVTKPKKG